MNIKIHTLDGRRLTEAAGGDAGSCLDTTVPPRGTLILVDRVYYRVREVVVALASWSEEWLVYVEEVGPTLPALGASDGALLQYAMNALRATAATLDPPGTEASSAEAAFRTNIAAVIGCVLDHIKARRVPDGRRPPSAPEPTPALEPTPEPTPAPEGGGP